jgi:two-component system OmpR family response regulator
MLRIEAILRRTFKARATNPRVQDVFEIGTLLLRSPQPGAETSGRERKLTKKEADVLRLLCMHRDQVLPRELVLNMVWGDDTYFLGRSLDVFISRLRKYLRTTPTCRS